MDRTLSLILPVCNAQSTLAARVAELLDILPELTPDFEVLIVDDGSTDQTGDIAWDLAREFPQVRLVSHALRRGTARAIRTGIDRASCDVVYVYEQHTPLNASELRSMWDSRGHRSPDTNLRQRARPRLAGLIHQLKKWGEAVTSSHISADPAAEHTHDRESKKSRGGHKTALTASASD